MNDPSDNGLAAGLFNSYWRHRLGPTAALPEFHSRPADPPPDNLPDVARIAQNIARQCGWPVFFCREDKRPACPNGFKDAVTDSGAIARLWRRHPGPLIGIRTGAQANLTVLDIDPKHDPAVAWWHKRHGQFWPTRIYRTRSGGLHYFFQYAPDIKCWSSARVPGLDTRSEGGYVIYWAAAGFECLNQSAPSKWPDWLTEWVSPPPPAPPPPQRKQRQSRNVDADKKLAALARFVASQAETNRNNGLYWASCRAAEMIKAGEIGRAWAVETLVTAAHSSGLPWHAAERTVQSALGSLSS